MFRALAYFLILFSPLIVLGQNHSDCVTALSLTAEDTLYHNVMDGIGVGERMEFKNNPPSDSLKIPEERQSFWYRIPMERSGFFYMTLEGEQPNDDWDFAIYRGHFTKKDCPLIVDGVVLPLRTNFANTQKTKEGKTGLKTGARRRYVAQGFGDPFCTPLKVNRGEELILYVGNWSQSGVGHNLRWHIKHSNKVIVRATMKDKETERELEGTISVSNFRRNYNRTLSEVTQFKDSFLVGDTLHFTGFAKGYELVGVDLILHADKEVVDTVLRLTKLQKDKNIVLPHINFVGDQSIFLPSAYPGLRALLNFMKENPQVSIEIQGYINWVGRRIDDEQMQLSVQRALAVRDFLIEHDIDSKRLTSKGFGNANMIFSNPVTPAQEEANRRVEIKILEL